MQTASINHIAITILDLQKSKKFYEPFLALLGYELKAELPNDHLRENSYFGCCLFGNPTIGTWVNLWKNHLHLMLNLMCMM